MHFFLTGERQVGKSTVVNRVLAALQTVPAGIRSVTVADVPGQIGSVYIVPAGDPSPVYSDARRIGIRCGGRFQAFPEAFERSGVALLYGAERAPLILMDEVGRMEDGAERYTRRILSLLDGGTPVLGVLRQEGETPLQETIRSHPNVRLFTVTRENRDALASELTERLRRELAAAADL